MEQQQLDLFDSMNQEPSQPVEEEYVTLPPMDG